MGRSEPFALWRMHGGRSLQHLVSALPALAERDLDTALFFLELLQGALASDVDALRTDRAVSARKRVKLVEREVKRVQEVQNALHALGAPVMVMTILSRAESYLADGADPALATRLLPRALELGTALLSHGNRAVQDSVVSTFEAACAEVGPGPGAPVQGFSRGLRSILRFLRLQMEALGTLPVATSPGAAPGAAEAAAAAAAAATAGARKAALSHDGRRGGVSGTAAPAGGAARGGAKSGAMRSGGKAFAGAAATTDANVSSCGGGGGVGGGGPTAEERIALASRYWPLCRACFDFLLSMCAGNNARAKAFLRQQSGSVEQVNLVDNASALVYSICQLMCGRMRYVASPEFRQRLAPELPGGDASGGGGGAGGGDSSGGGGLGGSGRRDYIAWHRTEVCFPLMRDLLLLASAGFRTLTEMVQGPEPENQLLCVRTTTFAGAILQYVGCM
ncbi:unnamed protein product, partial [Phaeothamnion confervicola]